MRLFKKREPEVVYYFPKDHNPECSPGKPLDWDRKQLWMDVVKIGLGQLVAVDEVLRAADAVINTYDDHFTEREEPEVPESFYEHDEQAPTVY